MSEPITEPGAYDLPEAEYHRDCLRHLGGSLSSTTARKLLPPSCPALARHAADNPEFKDAYDLGSVTHRLILGSGPRIVEVPADDWRTKAAKDARDEARAEGAVPLLTKDLRRALAMANAVHSHPLAHRILTAAGRPEQTLVWREGDDWGRAMLDYWPDPVEQTPTPLAADVKKTGKGLDDRSLQRSFWDYGYQQQAEWYSRGYYAVHGVWPAFVFIVVMDEPPFLVRVVELDDDLMADGRERNDRALQVWRQCRESGEWPGYGDDIALLSPPGWAR